MLSTLAGLGLSLALQTGPQAAPSDPSPLPDVIIEGRRLDEATRTFVDEVAAPPRGRSPARWQGRVCVGAVQLQREPAQYLIDRVSSVASELDLPIGEPGCRPNVVIFGAADGQALARTLVAERRRVFDTNVSGANRSDGALEDFQNSDRPVRWWHVSMQIDSETGQPAVSIPGHCRGDCSNPEDYAPFIYVRSASRLRSQIRDDLRTVFIVLDDDALAAARFDQVADYVAMVALAQIDPEADLAGFDTILNLFEPGGRPDLSLTPWDTAYLQGLYAADQFLATPRRNADVVAEAMADRARATAPGD